jgi:hypothetical protein
MLSDPRMERSATRGTAAGRRKTKAPLPRGLMFQLLMFQLLMFQLQPDRSPPMATAVNALPGFHSLASPANCHPVL